MHCSLPGSTPDSDVNRNVSCTAPLAAMARPARTAAGWVAQQGHAWRRAPAALASCVRSCSSSGWGGAGTAANAGPKACSLSSWPLCTTHRQQPWPLALQQLSGRPGSHQMCQLVPATASLPVSGRLRAPGARGPGVSRPAAQIWSRRTFCAKPERQPRSRGSRSWRGERAVQAGCRWEPASNVRLVWGQWARLLPVLGTCSWLWWNGRVGHTAYLV